jgi:hypothetical protein
MKSDSSKKKKKVSLERQKVTKNLMVMELLTNVPEFQKDVKRVRQDFGINDEGFDWGNSEMVEWAIEKDFEYYQVDNRELIEDQYVVSDEVARDSFPSNDFERKMLELGTKYKLPFNFFGFPYRGIPCYIIGNQIQTPDSNYSTNFRVEKCNDKNKLLWVNLIVYVPVSVKDFNEIAKDLKLTQESTLSLLGEESVYSEKNPSINFKRDLALLKKQKARGGTPRLVKKIKTGSYLDFALKDKGLSPKRKRQEERKRKKDVSYEHDKPTSSTIGKEEGVSSASARKAKSRLNIIAKEIFGYGIDL